MQRHLTSLVAVALGLAAAGTAQAKSHNNTIHGKHDASFRVARRDSHADRHHDHDRYFDRHHDRHVDRRHDHDRYRERRHDRDYRLTHGIKFDYGYYYKGRDHFNWSYRCWSRRYGCYCFYDSSALSWYYWCEPRGCYFPVSYISVAPPTVMVKAAADQDDEADEADSDAPPPPLFDKEASVDVYTPPAR